MKRVLCLMFITWILSLKVCYTSPAPLFEDAGVNGFTSALSEAAHEKGHMKLTMSVQRIRKCSYSMSVVEGLVMPAGVPQTVLVDDSALMGDGNIWMVALGRKKTANTEFMRTLHEVIYYTVKGCAHFDADVITNAMILPILSKKEKSVSVYSEEAGKYFCIECVGQDNENESIKIWAEYPE